MQLKKNNSNTSNKASSGIAHRNAIGVEISQTAIKMVQLTGRSLNQIQLEKYVITKLPKNIIQGGKIQDYEQIVSYLQHSYAQLKTNSRNIVASIPQNLTTVETLVYNEKTSELGLDDFVELEISQIATVEEMNYDYQVVGASISPPGQQILLAAAKKDDIEPRIEVFESAGIPPIYMDVDLFARSNAFSFWINHHAPELTDEKIAVIDIGELQTRALVLESGRILYKQETPVGGEQLGQLIQRTYQINEEKAENIKCHHNKRPEDYQSLIADRFNVQIAQEIQRVLQFYYTTQSNEQFSGVKHIFLTGGVASQPGLAETVFSQTNTATQCINPITYASNSSKVDLSQLQQDASALTVAFGLALRGL